MHAAKPWLFPLALWITCAHAVLSGADQSVVRGSVRRLDGAPHVAVPVQLLTPSNQVIQTVLSDARGEFIFTNVAASEYGLRCHVLGGFRYLGVDQLVRASEVAGDLMPQARRISLKPGQIVADAHFTFPAFKPGTWRTWTTQDGLPDSEIRKILPMPDGSLWIGTRNGLVRFDGKQFEILTTRTGLDHSEVLNLHLRPNGLLWVCTTNGVFRLNTRLWRQGQLHFDQFTHEDGLIPGRIEAVAHTPDRVLWFGGPQGLCRYDGTFRKFTEKDGFRPGHVAQLAVSSDGKLWLARLEQGLEVFTGDKFLPIPTANGIRLNVNALVVARGGSVWFSSIGSGVWKLDPGKLFLGQEAFTQISLNEGLAAREKYWSLHQAADGALWMGGAGALTRFDSQTIVNFLPADGLVGEQFITITETPGGILWFGSRQGLSRYDPATFLHYGSAHGLKTPEVRCRLKDRSGKVWYGAGARSRPDGGLYEWNGTTFQQRSEGAVLDIEQGLDGVLWLRRHSVAERFDGSQFVTVGSLQAGAASAIRDLAVAADGRVWVARGAAGLDLYDTNGKFIRNFALTELGLGAETSRVLVDDGVVWIGSEGDGLVRYDGSAFRKFTRTDGLAGNRVRRLSLDRSGRLWIGSDHGVSRMDGANFICFTRESGHLENNHVNAVMQDSKGGMWIGTESGLAREKNGIWSWLDRRDGLSGNTVFDLAEDPPGIFWIMTEQGITRYQPVRRLLPAPLVQVETEREWMPLRRKITVQAGRRIDFKLHVADLATCGSTRRFRFRVQNPAALGESDWEQWRNVPPGTDQVPFHADQAGRWRVSFQYVDRDLNESRVSAGTIHVVRPWYRDPRILSFAIVLSIGLILCAAIARWLYRRTRREI